MGSAASAGADTSVKTQESQAPKKQFLELEVEAKGPGREKPASAWTSNAGPAARKVDGPRLFNDAMSSGQDSDFEVKRDKTPKRPLDKMAGSPKRLNSSGRKPSFKDMDSDGDVDPDAADAVAMAQAAEARRKAKKKAEKKAKKLREEREAHAKAEAARFAAEEKKRAEEYAQQKVFKDKQWNDITSPTANDNNASQQPVAASSPKVFASNASPDPTSPRARRPLDKEGLKRRLSNNSQRNNSEDDTEQAASGGSGPKRSSSSRNNNSNDGDERKNTSALADELLQESSVFATSSSTRYKPGALPTYSSNFDNDKFRQQVAMKETSPGRKEADLGSPAGGGGGAEGGMSVDDEERGASSAAAGGTHARYPSGFVPLGRISGTGASASSSSLRGRGNKKVEEPGESSQDDEDFMDAILNDVDLGD